MSPALTTGLGLSATTGPGVNAGLPPIHIPQWHNPIPSYLKEIDGRKIYLQAKHNRLLEMHPNGVRGVNQFTEYCVLSLFMINITALETEQKMELAYSSLVGWDKSSDGGKSKGKDFLAGASKHILRSNSTNRFLCMDDRSVVYQSANFSSSHCVFNHEIGTESDDNRYTERYYRQVNSTKWYLGINRDGSMRCGNVTRKNQKSANFLKLTVGLSDVSKTQSPPYEEPKKECCTSNSCRRGKNRRKKGKNKCFKKWCRKHRRRFFTLKLKELRRYYQRCVKTTPCDKKKRKTSDR